MSKSLILSLLLFASASYSQTLTLTEPSFDFGDINNLKAVTREVEFKNTGDKELVVENVKGSCGCTTGKLEKNNYQPNETGKVEITFNPRGRSGKQTKTVTFMSNDAQEKTKTLNFTANVVPVYEITPNNVSFSFKENGTEYEATEKKIVLTNKWTGAIFVDSVKSQNDNVTVAGPTGTEVAAGGTLEYTVTVKADFIPDNHVYSQIYFNMKIDNEVVPQGVQLVITPPVKKTQN